MLTIRAEQLKILSKVEVDKYEDWVLNHLRRFFPRQCDAAGERDLRETIRYGIQSAASYGITDRRDVCKYIDLMVVFGRDFDRDTRLPWAIAILRELRHPRARMRDLIEAARKHLKR